MSLRLIFRVGHHARHGVGIAWFVGFHADVPSKQLFADIHEEIEA
jgi:hypothetical protein